MKAADVMRSMPLAGEIKPTHLSQNAFTPGNGTCRSCSLLRSGERPCYTSCKARCVVRYACEGCHQRS
jgi:hypothetical protein